MAKREREITENASLLKVNKQKPESRKSLKSQKAEPTDEASQCCKEITFRQASA